MAAGGGLRAVVITDLFQFLLLFGGATLVVITVTLRLGSLEWIPTRWNAAWDTQPLFSLDPTVRITVLGSVVYGVLWWVLTVGGDQTAIQRFMATADASSARRAFLTNSIAGTAVQILLALVGFALLAYFQTDPRRLGNGMTIAADGDLLFPYFISHHLPIGLSGLVVSGMFAAAMSSLDSGINSITAVVMTDFVDRFRKGPKLPDRVRVRASRLLAFGIGLAVVGSASTFMEHVPGNFLEMTQRTIGLFVTPLFLLFFLALFIPFATQAGAILAAASAFICGVLVAYSEPLAGYPISFQWIFPTSLTVGITTGCLVSLATGPWHKRQADPSED